MARIKFGITTVADAVCAPGKSASFIWDTEARGLGLRTSHGGAKRYIFQGKLQGQREVVRIKIGDIEEWAFEDARKAARALSLIIDSGRDPRQVKADGLDAEQAVRDAKQVEQEAAQARHLRESVTLGDVWPDYILDRVEHWSDLHHRDHLRMMQAGGAERKRSAKLTEPGPLASLAGVRLVDLTAERVEAWAKVEAKVRPTRARLALRLLKACLNWCTANKVYAGIVPDKPAHSKKARESLGKAKVKNDVLQREQLTAWFAAVRQIGNPVIAAYLQCLLLTGARREEVATLRWEDIDFRWNSLKLNDKVEEFRMVPMTPYVAHLLASLPRRGEWVFSSPAAASGRLMDPSNAHRRACAVAGLDITLHGLRRSFATLCEWTETPAGVAAQIQGHAPQGVREANYIRRPLDLLRMWHVKIEGWMLEQAGVEFVPVAPSLRIIA